MLGTVVDVVVGLTVVDGGGSVVVGAARGTVVAGSSSPPSSPPPPSPPEGTVVVVTIVVVVVAGASSSAFGAGVSRAYTSRLREPVPGLVTTLRVAEVAIADDTSAGVRAGFCDKAKAATPATCGAAIDVPDIVRVAVSDECPADTMLDPGANTSRQEPKFEKDDRSSLDVVDPTVIASGSPAGDTVHALTLEFPAATTKVTPSEIPRETAKSRAAERGPPRLMFATAGTPA